MTRTYDDPNLVPYIERSEGNVCATSKDVFDHAAILCEEYWPFAKGKVSTERGERRNSHFINPDGILNLMKEFTKRDQPDWYLLNLIEWCNVKSNDMGRSLLNYLERVQVQYFKKKGNYIFALDDALDDEEEEIVLPKVDVTNVPHKKENEPGVIPVPRKKRRQVSNRAPRDYWSVGSIAKEAGCTDAIVMKALRSSQLVGEKRKGNKWIVPKAAAKAWAEAFRLVAQ